MARIKRISFSPKFTELQMEAYMIGERNDCTVKAVALVCDVPYKTAHEALKKVGRENGKRTFEYLAAVRSLGFHVREWSFTEKQEVIWSYPKGHTHLHSITTHHPRRFPKAWMPHRNKRLLFLVHRHIAAVVRGEVHDWTVNKSKRVTQIWEVWKIDQ